MNIDRELPAFPPPQAWTFKAIIQFIVLPSSCLLINLGLYFHVVNSADDAAPSTPEATEEPSRYLYRLVAVFLFYVLVFSFVVYKRWTHWITKDINGRRHIATQAIIFIVATTFAFGQSAYSNLTKYFALKEELNGYVGELLQI